MYACSSFLCIMDFFNSKTDEYKPNINLTATYTKMSKTEDPAPFTTPPNTLEQVWVGNFHAPLQLVL